MSLSVKLTPYFNSTLLSHPRSHQFVCEGYNGFFQRKGGITLLMPCYLADLNNNTHLCLTLHTRLCSNNTNDNVMTRTAAMPDAFLHLLNVKLPHHCLIQVPELSDSSSHEGSEESKESKKGESLSINEIMKKLKRYGVSGILSYGLLNTAYYLSTFLFVWFYIAPAPGKMGYLAAVERFLKLMAMVWAGSQVTKLVRAAGALALAPFVDRALTWFTEKFKFQSQGKAFMAIVGFCFGLALFVFLVITLLWA